MFTLGQILFYVSTLSEGSHLIRRARLTGGYHDNLQLNWKNLRHRKIHKLLTNHTASKWWGRMRILEFHLQNTLFFFFFWKENFNADVFDCLDIFRKWLVDKIRYIWTISCWILTQGYISTSEAVEGLCSRDVSVAQSLEPEAVLESNQQSWRKCQAEWAREAVFLGEDEYVGLWDGPPGYGGFEKSSAREG